MKDLVFLVQLKKKKMDKRKREWIVLKKEAIQ